MLRVAVNGKFMSAPLEGMPRVGERVLRAMDALICGDTELQTQFDIEVLYPRNTVPGWSPQSIKFRQVGRLQGQLWEQLDFPRYSIGRVGINFTSTGPVLKPNCLTVVHDAQMFSTPNSFARKHRIMYQVLSPLVGRVHKSVVTVSDFARSELDRYRVTPTGKAEVVYNAADHLADVLPDYSVLRRHGLESRPYVLSNGYLHAHKNVQTLARAMAALARPDTTLVLFGNVDRSDYAERQIPLPANTQFVGRVSDAELRALMERAAVFAFPSRTEGFGLPPLEAMYLGTACLVSRAGAIPEVCQDGALYADPEDLASWVSGLRRLLDDSVTRAQVARQGMHVAQTYSWQQSARSYLAKLLRDFHESN